VRISADHVRFAGTGQGALLLTAGNAGSDSHPAWYYNLAANPDVTVEAGNEAFEAVAVIAGEAERAALCQRFAVARSWTATRS
jgi:deazaflavin-dependent oxidoreductase (nitroreductase family)